METAERANATEPLYISKLQLQTVLMNMTGGVIISDPHGNLIRCNDAAYKIHQFQSRAEWQTNFHNISKYLEVYRLDGTLLPVEFWPLSRALGGETFSHMEVTVKRKDTGNSPNLGIFNYGGTAIRDANKNIILAAITVEDITERKRTEEALLKSEQEANEKLAWFQTLMEILPVGVWISDHSGKVISVNRAAIELYGRPDPVGGPGDYSSYKVFRPDTGEPVSFEPYVPDEALNGETLDFERFDGTKGRQIASTNAIRDTDGNIINYLAVAMDITKLKQTEDALKESEQKARILIQELELANKNKNHFISVLSHEIRNPLAAITAALSLLDITEEKEKRAGARMVINRQMNHLTRLVDDLLDLSRITRNKVKLKIENVLLNELVMHIGEDMGPEYGKNGVRLWKKVQKRHIFVHADSLRISQCIENLLKNALKFSQPGGSVWLTLKQEGSEAVVSVRDTGSGIDPAVQPYIFEPFFQEDVSLQKPTNGLGLGLPIVNGIVNLHDGKVTVHSEGAGKGATFTIRLPAADKEVRTGRPAQKRYKTGMIYKILVIDDNKDLADMLYSLIGIMGHRAFTAYDGLEGIKKAREIRPDIIFCDISMPEKDGYEVARIIKEDKELQKAYLIAMTGYAMESDIEQSLRSGFDKHMAKPVDSAAIRKVLAEIQKAT